MMNPRLRLTDGLEITSRIADKRDIFGTLDEIIEGAIAFVRLHNVTSANLEMRPREEHSLFPFHAAKESIINAVVHRNYSITGSKIRLFIFRDRLEVRSPGRLPNTVTLEKIKMGTSYLRNQFLARFLNNLGYMERLGTGIPMMVENAKAHSGREPLFQELDEEFWVTLYSI